MITNPQFLAELVFGGFYLFKIAFTHFQASYILALQPKATQTLYWALYCSPFAFFFFSSCLLQQHLHKHRTCRSIKKIQIGRALSKTKMDLCHQARQVLAAH